MASTIFKVGDQVTWDPEMLKRYQNLPLTEIGPGPFIVIGVAEVSAICTCVGPIDDGYDHNLGCSLARSQNHPQDLQLRRPNGEVVNSATGNPTTISGSWFVRS